MPAFDKLQRASFEGVEFPVEEVDVNGGIRDHIHEYPHADGGAPEKMGRKLYTIRMVGIFQATFLGYPKLWPEGLKKIRGMFEKQLTGDLVIPTIGKIKAYARNWNESMVARASRSGVKATFEFVEDQEGIELTNTIVEADVNSLAKGYAQMDAAMALADFEKEADIGIFDAVLNAVNSVLAVVDITEAGANLVSAKLLMLSDLCAQASNTLTAQSAKNALLISALHNLWDTSNQSAKNLVQDSAQILKFVLPTPMSISQVAVKLYGDTSRNVELLQMNPIEDAFAIPAGFHLSYVKKVVSLPGGTVTL